MPLNVYFRYKNIEIQWTLLYFSEFRIHFAVHIEATIVTT